MPITPNLNKIINGVAHFIKENLNLAPNNRVENNEPKEEKKKPLSEMKVEFEKFEELPKDIKGLIAEHSDNREALSQTSKEMKKIITEQNPSLKLQLTSKEIEKINKGELDEELIDRLKFVRRLKLEGDAVTDETLENLLPYCKKLELLSVSRCKNLTDNALDAIVKCTTLKQLDLSWCTQIKTLKALTPLKNLNTLYVSGINFDVSELEPFTKLEHLDLIKCDLNFKQLALSMDKLKELKTLNLANTDIGINAFFQNASKYKNLKAINSAGTIFYKETVAMFKKKNPQTSICDTWEEWSDIVKPELDNPKLYN